MKEHPILFSGPMVRAILAGAKTQTRRIVKPQPERNTIGGWRWVGKTAACGWTTQVHPAMLADCPYGVAGDRLWVREAWCVIDDAADKLCIGYRARELPDADRAWISGLDEETRTKLIQRSTWRPPIFMPRWASRITLEVTGVRVERLHEITQDDAFAEGMGHVVDRPGAMLRDRFQLGWDGLHGEGAWEANPWVWVVSFRRVL